MKCWIVTSLLFFGWQNFQASELKMRLQAIKILQKYLYDQDRGWRALAVENFHIVSELFYPRAYFITQTLKGLPGYLVGTVVLPVITNILGDRFWWYAVDARKKFIAEHIECLLKEMKLYYEFLQTAKINAATGLLVDTFVPGVVLLKNYLLKIGYTDQYRDFLLVYFCFLVRKMASCLMVQTKDIQVFLVFNNYYLQTCAVYNELITLTTQGNAASLHETMEAYQRFYTKLKDQVL